MEVNNANVSGDMTLIVAGNIVMPSSSHVIPSAISHNLPRSGVANFIGRDFALIEQALCDESGTLLVAIHGMGGIGKSELALQYAYNSMDRFKGGCCWLDGAGGRLAEQIVSYSRNYLSLNPPEGLQLKQQVAYCYSRWPRSGLSLIVIDDVNDFSLLEGVIPPLDLKFRVLITTRQIPEAPFKGVQLDVLAPGAAVELLATYVGSERISEEGDLSNNLCERLGFLPLAVELSGRFLFRHSDMSVLNYIKQLEIKGVGHPGLSNVSPMMTARRGVEAAIRISWDQLTSDAQLLMCRLSYLSLAPIPWNLVDKRFEGEEGIGLESIRDEEILRLSLIVRLNRGLYSFHPLVRDFIRIYAVNLTNRESELLAWSRVILEYAIIDRASATMRAAEAFRVYAPHLEEVSEFVRDEDIVRAYSGISFYYIGFGDMEKSLMWCSRSVVLAKKRLGETHKTSLVCMNNYAQMIGYMGNNKKAIELYGQLIEFCQGKMALNEDLILICKGNMASFMEANGDVSGALVLLHEVCAAHVRRLGQFHPDALTSQLLFAWTLARTENRENIDAAIRQMVPILKYYEQNFGADDPKTVSTMSNLATALSKRGDLVNACKLMEEALGRTRNIYGPEHSETLSCMNGWGDILFAARRFPEMEENERARFSILVKKLGPEHSEVLSAMSRICDSLFPQKKLEAAVELRKKIMEIRINNLGVNDPATLNAMNNLAWTYIKIGNSNEAKRILKIALPAARNALPSRHPILQNLEDASSEFG